MSAELTIIAHDTLDALSGAVLVLGSDGSILAANQAALDVYGHCLADMLDMRIDDLRAPEAQTDIDVRSREAAKAGVLFESVHLRGDGSPFPVEVRSFPVTFGGKVALLSFMRDLTATKRQQQELLESESRYRALAETSPLAVFVFRNLRGDDRVVLANPACLKLFGASAQGELVGRSVLELFDTDDQATTRKRLRQFAKKPLVFDGQILRIDGTKVDVEVAASALLDQGVAAVQVVLRDITERKQAHDELRRAHDLFRDTFEHASVGIAHVGVDGAWLNVNQTLCDMLGYSAKELLKTTFIGITRPDDIAEGAEQLRQLLRGDASTYAVETRYVRRDGGASWFALNVAVIRAKNGAAEYFVAVLTDISERKHNEELLAVQLARIEKTLTSVLDIANNIVEERDPYTAGHERRVAELATRIAQDLKMSDQDVDDIRVAGLLHDIGKVSVPAEILSKPGVLSEVERDLIRVHAEAGAHIVSSAHMEGPIAELVYQHHERCDGSGYPRGLSGDRISAGAKVIAVADVIEAMMSHRPYRAALGLEAGLAEIENGAGRLYGADAARSCVGLFRSGRFEFSDYASEPASVGTP